MCESLKELLDQVYQRTSGAVRPGLDTITALLEALGNPQQQLAVIHVAGTNGKGSVCAMLEAMLGACGISAGLYTSPHLVRVNERFRIRDEMISDEELYAFLTRIVEADRLRCESSGGRAATFFELTTALAYLYFFERGVKIAVVEVGMGGRWDATNVIVPLLSVITNVDMDHTNYLGHTLIEIAGEKCGIIKRERPVVIGELSEEALRVVQAEAKNAAAPVIRAADAVSVLHQGEEDGAQLIHVESARCSYGRMRLPLLGTHQLGNCAVAVAAFEEVAEMIGIPPGSAVRDGLQRTEWRGRLEQVGRDPVMLVDGAHNPGGIRCLVSELKRRFTHRPVALICGILADKDIDRMIEPLTALRGHCWTVRVNNERTADPALLAEKFIGGRMRAEASELGVALEQAQDWARREDGMVVVAGSLFLVGEVLARLDCHE
jgi:dihydrofolate synthase/folylpolyglutamate synthase